MIRFLKNKNLWILLASTLLLGLIIQGATHKNLSANIGIVTRNELIQRVTIAGSVGPNRKTVISAPYSGYIRKLHVHLGDRVKEGDPVVSLAQSLHANSEDVYPLRAPFSGTVVQVLKTEGEYVDYQSTQVNGSAIVRIDDLTRIFVDASCPEGEVGKLKLGQEAIIKASAVLERPYHGKIESISLAAKEQKDWDKSRVEFSVLIEILDKDSRIKPGMSVLIDIIARKLDNVLTLRHEFIRKDGNQYFVINEKGEKKKVEVGLQNEEVFEIKNGVAENEKIRQTDFLSILKEP